MSDPITRLNAALEGRYRIERQLGEGGIAEDVQERWLGSNLARIRGHRGRPDQSPATSGGQLMKKLATVVLLAALGLVTTTTAAAAQFVYVGAGPTFPMSDYKEYANTGFLVAGGVGFPLGDAGLSALVEGSWGQNNHETDGDKTNPLSVLGGLQYDLNPGGEGINPYVFAQAGLMWHRYSSDTFGNDSDSAFGYGAGAGVGFPLGGVNGWVEGRFLNAAFDETGGGSSNTMFAAIIAGITFDLGS